MGEIWTAMGVSTTITVGLMIFLFTNLSGRIDALDAKFTARPDAMTDRLDRVVEMLAQHQHR